MAIICNHAIRSARGHCATSTGSLAIRAASRRSCFALAMEILRMSEDGRQRTDDGGQRSEHPPSGLCRPSSVLEMSVSDVCELLAAWRRLRIEPMAYIFKRAAERLRNRVEAEPFAGHALRSHQFLQRPA